MRDEGLKGARPSHEYIENTEQNPYFKELVNLAQVDPLLGI